MTTDQELQAQVEALTKKLDRLDKINKTLMDRVERSVDSQGSAYALFESNILLQQRVAEHTRELELANELMRREMQERKEAEDELRKSHAQYTMLLRTSQAPMFVVSEGVIIFANPAMARLLGYIDETDVLGKHLQDIVFDDDQSMVLNRYERRIRGEYVPTRYEYRVKCRDGSSCWIEMTAQRREYEGKLAVHASLHDIDSRKRAEIKAEEATAKLQASTQELARKNAELDEALTAAVTASRVKSEFVANMSHEIRTPMNGVIGMTRLLLDTELSAEQHEYAITIEQSAEALLAIINDVLDFSKIEAGKLDIENIDFDLRELLEKSAELIAPKAHEKGLELVLDINPHVPALQHGDPGRIRQVLLNLLSNAVKFTEKGEVVIQVRQEKSDLECPQLWICVHDTGVGIPPDKLETIFESFTQADASTTRRFGGTGLGLAISKRLVALMGGQIGLNSDEDSGSTFWFTLPLREQSAKEADKPATLEQVRNIHVLVVDDNQTNRNILSRQLSTWGIGHDLAEDAEAALELLRTKAGTNEAYDLAILDYYMPGMNGEELARQIKDDPQLADISLVLLTSAAQRGDAKRMGHAGFSAYLVKPVKQSTLFDCIATLIGHSQEEDETRQRELVTQHSISEARRHNLRLLLVEDNRVNQKVAMRILTRAGYNADLAVNGLEAVERVKTGAYDIVLMDCQMPVMDGYEATREIRKLPEEGKLPVIAMTAHAMAGDREKCIAAGMTDYLAKPVEPEKLLRMIEKYCLADEPPELAFGKVAGEPVEAEPEEPAVLIPPVDIQASISRAGDEEFWVELMNAYIEESYGFVESIEQALTDENQELLVRSAHSMKGASAELLLERVREEAYKIEMAGKDLNLNAVPGLLTSLRRELQAAVDYCRPHIDRLSQGQ
ncbi:response regulator [bacterium]|nr:response regulator [bacterium]